MEKREIIKSLNLIRNTLIQAIEQRNYDYMEIFQYINRILTILNADDYKQTSELTGKALNDIIMLASTLEGTESDIFMSSSSPEGADFRTNFSDQLSKYNPDAKSAFDTLIQFLETGQKNVTDEGVVTDSKPSAPEMKCMTYSPTTVALTTYDKSDDQRIYEVFPTAPDERLLYETDIQQASHVPYYPMNTNASYAPQYFNPGQFDRQMDMPISKASSDPKDAVMVSKYEIRHIIENYQTTSKWRCCFFFSPLASKTIKALYDKFPASDGIYGNNSEISVAELRKIINDAEPNSNRVKYFDTPYAENRSSKNTDQVLQELGKLCLSRPEPINDYNLYY